MKLKGIIEKDVEALQFPGLTILRPPSLIRKRAKRPAETVSVKLFQLANTLGLFKTMAPVPTESVARKWQMKALILRKEWRFFPPRKQGDKWTRLRREG